MQRRSIARTAGACTSANVGMSSEMWELNPGGSKGMTQHGSSSVLWLYASKPVGGEDR